jgi:ATP-dependent protease ClpP protease subunit
MLTIGESKDPTKISQVMVPSPIPVVYVSEFTEESSKKFVDQLDAAVNVGAGIVLVSIDSYGGSVLSLLSMVNHVEAHQKAGVIIATSVEGKAMSAGSVLFASGTNGYRFVGPYSTILIHSVSSQAGGKVPDLINDIEEATRLNNLLFTILARKSGKPDSYFMDLVRSKGGVDWFISPKEAVSLGLANKIKVPERKTILTIENTIE